MKLVIRRKYKILSPLATYRYLVVSDDPTARILEKHGLEIAKGQGADLLNSI